MVTFGIDISHHQPVLDFPRMKSEGIEFVFLKATEGSAFKDSKFLANVGRANAAGMLVAAYHYVRDNVSAASQVANIQQIVPRWMPVIPDVEANSGGVALVREIVERLKDAGYHVPLSYIPLWYWRDHMGKPDLRGLPPLWSSRYPDNVVDTLPNEWADVPGTYWNGYGGLNVEVLQFTSSARIAGYAPLDGNAYRGTKEQLAALLSGGSVDMPLSTEDLNNIWMFPCIGVGPDGKAQTHPAVAWITTMAYRVNGLEKEVAALSGRDPVDVNEQEVAFNLAPLLVGALEGQLSSLQPEDFQRIADAVADEQARRMTRQGESPQ